MIRKSTARWRGDGRSGQGALSVQSGAFTDQPYSFETRFESEDGKAGTNPEELLGAAHAGCFAMALSFVLGEAGFVPEELRVTAAVEIRKVGDGFAITGIALDLEGRVPNVDGPRFEQLAKAAKENCPLSKALAATPITLSVKLV